MYKNFLYSILIIFTFVIADSVYSQDAVLSKVNTGSGLNTTDFLIPEGVLTVYLPSDMTVAESVSGTILLKGNTSQNSIAQLTTKYNLVAESQIVPLIGNNFVIQIPVNLPTGVLSISLQDKQSRILNRAFFPVRLTKRSPLPVNPGGAGNFRTPVTSRAGMPAVVNGPFDGDFQNSFISISGRPAILLSESTRQLVFLIPDGVQGPKVLSLREGTTEFKTPFTVLHVVKVGRDNPALVTRKDGTNTAGPMAGAQGVLIESEEQFGKIDLEYNPDLGKTSQDKNSPAPVKRKITATEEPALAPSINDLSKPLELDPEDLEKYTGSGEIKESKSNELESLKQFSDKLEDKPKAVVKTAAKAPEKTETLITKNTNAGYADIKDVKTLLDKQISSSFTPLETSGDTNKSEKLTAKNNQEIKQAPGKPKAPVKKADVKPVAPAPKAEAKTVTPKTPAPKPPVKKATPVAKVTPPKKTVTKPTSSPADYSNKMNDKVVKPKKDPKKQEKKTVSSEVDAVDKKDKQKTTSKSVSSSKTGTNKYKKINDLSSLNTGNGPYQNNDKNKQVSTGTKSGSKVNEQIKEDKYVSLNKKETLKPNVTTPAARGKFAIQLASFKKKSEATELVGKLNSSGYDVYYKRYKVPGKGYWYRVRKGGFSSRNEAEAYKSSLNLTKYHINSFFVTTED